MLEEARSYRVFLWSKKMRWDRLNGRFLELCSNLEPGRLQPCQPIKADKVVILNNATHRLLNQLRLEAQNKLKAINDALKITIQNLKAEKQFKAEKERMEQMVVFHVCPIVPPHTSYAATTTLIFLCQWEEHSLSAKLPVANGHVAMDATCILGYHSRTCSQPFPPTVD
uniref:Uncharacterized protein n=1 Tax=Nelumbo nucifera TaxID=4432 RepID=A0A822YA99_NELNU|nr:TPA_asm: hypothetical protein HUJ06_029667 [Nelumbo nucifera]